METNFPSVIRRSDRNQDSNLENDSASGLSQHSGAGADAGSSEHSSDVSDWEREIDPEDGTVFFVAQETSENNPEVRSRETPQELTLEANSGTLQQRPKQEKRRTNKGLFPDKLSRFVIRRRESKRERGLHAQIYQKQNARSPLDSSDTESNTYAQLKTFESVFEAANNEIKNVQVRVKGRKSLKPEFAGLGNLTESMLGVVPESYQEESPEGGLWSGVIVAGIIPGGPASKVGDRLRVGDIVRLVDGQQVNYSTIEQLLSTYSSSTKITLTVQRSAATLNAKRLYENDDLESRILEKCLIVYLKNSEEEEENEEEENSDVLYRFPNSDGEEMRLNVGDLLLKIKGIFTTLTHAMPDLAKAEKSTSSAPPVFTSVSVTFEDGQEKMVRVAAVQDTDSGVLMVAVPADSSDSREFRDFFKNFTTILKLMFGGVRESIEKGAYREKVDSIARSMLLEICSRDKVASTNLPTNALSHEVKFQIDDALHQFESADFQDLSEEFYDSPREFNILGSCLFFRGLLTASHLPAEVTERVTLICKHRSLLKMSAKAGTNVDVVVWNEIFFNSEADEGKRNPERPRTFLLIVGQGQSLLATILGTDLGTLVYDHIVQPNPLYVEEALTTLDHLEDMNIPRILSEQLQRNTQ